MNNVKRALSISVFTSTMFSGAVYADPDTIQNQTRNEFTATKRSGETATSAAGNAQDQALPERRAVVPSVAGKTRAQVEAELVEAIHTGDIYLGDSSFTEYELSPSRYPARPTVAGKTRAQVKAELAEAVRTGDIYLGDSSLTEYELSPYRYPARPVVVGKTCAEVLAELVAAKKAGELRTGEDGLSDRERFPQRCRTKEMSQDIAHGGSAVSTD